MVSHSLNSCFKNCSFPSAVGLINNNLSSWDSYTPLKIKKRLHTWDFTTSLVTLSLFHFNKAQPGLSAPHSICTNVVSASFAVYIFETVCTSTLFYSSSLYLSSIKTHFKCRGLKPTPTVCLLKNLSVWHLIDLPCAGLIRQQYIIQS